MPFLSEHWAHLVGGGSAGAGGAAVFAMVFRDSIRQWLDDWKDERRAKRAERMAASGHNDRGMTELIHVITKSVDDQRANDVALRELLTRMVVADERSLDVQRMTSTQLSEIDKRMFRMEGALNAGGRFVGGS